MRLCTMVSGLARRNDESPTGGETPGLLDEVAGPARWEFALHSPRR
jgi:hypothetical protein